MIKGTNHSMAESDYKKQTREFCFICRTLSCVTCLVQAVDTDVIVKETVLGNSATYAVHAQQQTYRWVSCREELIHLRSHQCHRRGSWGMKIHGLVHLPKVYRLRYGLVLFQKGEKVGTGSLEVLS